MHVTLCDVGPRDGLQNEPETLAPDVRADLVRRLAAAGLPRIEAVSFVSGRARAADGGRGGGRRGGGRGRRRALRARPQRARLGAAGGDAARPRQRHARGHGDVQPAQRQRDRSRRRPRASSGSSPSPTGPRRRRSAARSAARSRATSIPVSSPISPSGSSRPGAGEVVLADTIGVATPRPVARLVERVSILGVPVGGHFHDTRHTGVACAWAAVEAGATRARRVRRRSRRLPVRAARDRQRRHRGRALPARPRAASRPASTSTR